MLNVQIGGELLRIIFFFWILTTLAPISTAQSLPAVSAAFGGKVQLQRAGENNWMPVTKRFELKSGDKIRTGYKSFIVFRVEPANQIVTGSNTTMLFETQFVPKANEQKMETKVTISEGGVFFSWAGGSLLTALTNDGSVSFPKGMIAVTYERKNTTTTFTAFVDSLTVEHIPSKKAANINSGQYSNLNADGYIIESKPLDKQTSEKLRQWFGDRFLNKLFQRLSIEVVENEPKKADAQAARPKAEVYTENTQMKPLFNSRKIMQIIQQIEGLGQSYQPPPPMHDRFDHKYFIEAGGAMTNTNPDAEVKSYLGMNLRCGLRMDDLSVALNVPFAADNQGNYSLALSGFQGILDKIYYADYRNRQWNFTIHAGRLEALTFNKGALVRNFSNELMSQIAQPLGIHALYDPHPFLMGQFFLADLSDPMVMGTNWQFDNGWTIFGVSAVFDFNQGDGFTFGDGENNQDSSSRFRSLNPQRPKFSSKTRMVWGWDAHAEINFIQDSKINVFGYVDGMFLYAQGEGRVGAVVQVPGIQILYRRISAFIEGVMTADKAHPGYFNDFYLEDRARVINGKAFSQVERHPPMSISRGFRAGLSWQVKEKLWTEIEFGRNFGVTTANDTNYTAHDEQLLKLNIDQSALFRIIAGDNLLPVVKRLELWYRLQHGQLGRELAYPRTPNEDGVYGEFMNWKNELPFLSLNLSSGFSLEFSIMKFLSIITQCRGYGYDFNGNSIYEPGEIVLEFGAAVRTKF